MMTEVDDLIYKCRQRLTPDYNSSNTPNIAKQDPARIVLPIQSGVLSDLDKEMIQLLISYKTEVEERLEENIRENLKEEFHQTKPEAKKLASFIYDHLDDFDRVLDDEEYDELESLISSIK